MLINSESEKSAVLALLKKKYKLQHKAKLSEKNRKLLHCFNICQYSMKELIEKVKHFHAPISKYFASGIGIKLQNMDAKIAMNVIDYFAQKNVPCLPIHDSFIIEKYHQDELKNIMQKSFFEMFHTKIDVH